jgi:anti-sigma regulatory factor (Ser/Thr protein kinase)
MSPLSVRAALPRHAEGAVSLGARDAHRARPGGRGFRHQGLLHAGDRGFLAATVPYIEDGSLGGEAVVVAVGPHRTEMLRSVLRERRGLAEASFLDMRTLGANPARIIPALWELRDELRREGRRVRGICEPAWAGRSAAELSECDRHEALLNLAFQDGPGWQLLCPYDVDALPRRTIDAALRTHPLLAAGGACDRNPRFASHAGAPDPFAGTLPAPPVSVERITFECRGLLGVRQLVARIGARVSLAYRRTGDLVLAVDELATNSVRHGGGGGTLTAWVNDGAVVCEVSDTGRIADPLAGRRSPPPPTQPSGRGLWIVNQVCDLVQVRSSAAGTSVRVHMRLP